MVNKKDKKKIIAATAAGLLYKSQSKKRFICLFGCEEDSNIGGDSSTWSPNMIYGPFPVTLKDYDGDKINSVSYTGQIARHVLHDSLKAAAGNGDGELMMKYYENKDKEMDDVEILAPANRDGFIFKQKTLGEISTGKNLSEKTYKENVYGWQNMPAKNAIIFMIKKADNTEDGYDPDTGYNYQQLISKFVMGAVSYHQAVDNYLDEKLEAGNKPNDKPYKEGKYYTGKEHSWDEAWGYWGAPSHSSILTPKENYNIAKRKNLSAADYDRDGLVDLKSEYCFGHAYYAASFDKGGNTNYLATTNKAFIDGRRLITSANGEKLSDDQRKKLRNYSYIIKENWEKVIAEAIFKYAGSTYEDIEKIEKKASEGKDTSEEYRDYAKHWGELKGFVLALECSGFNGSLDPALPINLHNLIGLGPVLRDNSQVVRIDSNGNYIKTRNRSLESYKFKMSSVQELISIHFDLKARVNQII